MILIGTKRVGKGKKESVFAQCECSHPEHYVEFSWFHDDTIIEFPEMYIQVGMARLGFWKRLWHGVKYIVGHRSDFVGGSYEEAVLDQEDVEKLIEFLIQARSDINKEAERHAQAIDGGIAIPSKKEQNKVGDIDANI